MQTLQQHTKEWQTQPSLLLPAAVHVNLVTPEGPVCMSEYLAAVTHDQCNSMMTTANTAAAVTAASKKA